MSENLKETDNKAGIVHHYHHREEPSQQRRELHINCMGQSITLCSDDESENIEYLCGKAMKILEKLREDGK